MHTRRFLGSAVAVIFVSVVILIVAAWAESPRPGNPSVASPVRTVLWRTSMAPLGHLYLPASIVRSPLPVLSTPELSQDAATDPIIELAELSSTDEGDDFLGFAVATGGDTIVPG